MKFSFLSLVLVLGFLGNCGSFMPREQRRLEFIQETNLKKKEIYDRGLVFLAKSLGVANLAISIRDPENGRIISLFTMPCPNFSSTLYSLNYKYLRGNIDLTAKDNKYRIILDDLELIVSNENSVGMALNSGNMRNNPQIMARYPNDQSDLDNIKNSCGNELKEAVIKAIEGKGITTDKDF